MPACSKPNNDIVSAPEATTASAVLLARVGTGPKPKQPARAMKASVPEINTSALTSSLEVESAIRDLEKLQSRKGVDGAKVERQLSRLRKRLAELKEEQRSDPSKTTTGVMQAANRGPTPTPILRSELARLQAGNGTNSDVGDFSEAVVAGLEVISGRALLMQHNPGDKPQGLDIQSVDASGKVWAIEVKGTRSAGKRPSGDRYAAGRQGSQGYVHDRSQDAPIRTPLVAAVGPEQDQMGSLLVQVNIADGEVTLWELDEAGRRTSSLPTETWPLEEVVQVIDAT